MIEGFTEFINPAAIDVDALTRLRELATMRIVESSPEFGSWLRSWCETEEVCRKTSPEQRPARHVIALPPAHKWTNQELGKALRAITSISLMPLHGSLDEFVDRVTCTISEEAAARLENHDA